MRRGLISPSSSASVMQMGQCTAAQAVCRNDHHPHLCRSPCPVRPPHLSISASRHFPLSSTVPSLANLPTSVSRRGGSSTPSPWARLRSESTVSEGSGGSLPRSHSRATMLSLLPSMTPSSPPSTWYATRSAIFTRTGS